MYAVWIILSILVAVTSTQVPLRTASSVRASKLALRRIFGTKPVLPNPAPAALPRAQVPVRTASSVRAARLARFRAHGRTLSSRGRFAVVRRPSRLFPIIPNVIPGQAVPLPNPVPPVQAPTYGSHSVPVVVPLLNPIPPVQAPSYGSQSVAGVFPQPIPVPAVQVQTQGIKTYPVLPNVAPQPNPVPSFVANPVIPFNLNTLPPFNPIPAAPVNPYSPPPSNPNPVPPFNLNTLPPFIPNPAAPATPYIPPLANPNPAAPVNPNPAAPANPNPNLPNQQQSIPTQSPLITPPVTFGGCPIGSFPQECATSTACETSACRAFPDAVCRVDRCAGCKVQYFVKEFAVSCDLCPNGYTPLAGPNPCDAGAVCGPGTYCSPRYCVQPIFATPQFECLPVCRDSSGNMLGDGRRAECLEDPCKGHLCPFGEICQSNPCTCQSRCRPGNVLIPQTNPSPVVFPTNPPQVVPNVPTNPPAALTNYATNPPLIVVQNLQTNPPPPFNPSQVYPPNAGHGSSTTG